MALPNPNRLLVEDTDIMGVVIGLMKHHVEWGTVPEKWPVVVAKKLGKSSVMTELPVEIKGSNIKRLGIVIDADDDLDGTWAQVVAFCKKIGAAAPRKCPKEGFTVAVNGQVFGAWIMPNNEMAGMVEHFCHGLVPKEAEGLWKYAEECAKEAKKRGAPFPDQYLPKAHIHTWLAWQATPGERMGAAITGKSLEHESESAKAFVKWFCTLYDLKLKSEANVPVAN